MTARRTDAQGRKWDESDFAFTQEDYSSPEQKPKYQLLKGRIVGVPPKRRNKTIGFNQTRSIVICIHGKLTTQPCSLCEYEAPRFTP